MVYQNLQGKTFPSDLRKLTAVSKSLSLSKNQISCYWETIHYIETNRMRNLHLQLLLVASEVGVPLCMGNHNAWDRCTSPTPCKTTSVRGEKKWMPQENNGKAVTQWPTRKASLGWKNRKLWLLPWTSTRASTEDGWRPQVTWCGCRPQ